MVISNLIQNYLNYIVNVKHVSQKTIENYQHYLSKFLDFAGDRDLKLLTPEVIAKYKIFLASWKDDKGRGLKKLTQNFFLIALRDFVKYLKQKKLTSFSHQNIGLYQKVMPVSHSLDNANLARLLSMPDISDEMGLRDKAILEILFSTGIKVSEAVNLNRENINLLNNQIIVISKKKKRVMGVSQETTKWLVSYLHSRKDNFQPLLIRYQGQVRPEDQGEKMRLTPRSIQRVVEKYARKAGIEVSVTPQLLRASFAQLKFQQGRHVLDVQKTLGLDSTSATKQYAKKN